MRIWIDATRPGTERPVFGMALLERQLQAIAVVRGLEPGEIGSVEISIPADSKLRQSVPEELQRQLGVQWTPASGSVASRLQAVLKAAGKEAVLALSGDCVIDTRLIQHMTREGEATAFAGARTEGIEPGAIARLEGELEQIDDDAPDLADVVRRALDRGELRALAPGEFDDYIAKLRRHFAPYVLKIGGEDDARRVERFLFWSNYKGSTDFMTRYVYPPLVWLLVPPLARRRIHPNWVTGIDIVATFAAIPFFMAGAWLPGFALAYLMSVLDSVDGKLARLTYTSSWLGNLLDHGLDIVHPPFWYLAWGWALSEGNPSSAPFQASLWMFGLYVADRLCAVAFKRRTGRSIHGFTRLDERMRTFISRRNVNLPIFMGAIIADALFPWNGSAAAMLYVIVAWQAVCLVFHAQRVIQYWSPRPIPATCAPQAS